MHLVLRKQNNFLGRFKQCHIYVFWKSERNDRNPLYWSKCTCYDRHWKKHWIIDHSILTLIMSLSPAYSNDAGSVLLIEVAWSGFSEQWVVNVGVGGGMAFKQIAQVLNNIRLNFLCYLQNITIKILVLLWQVNFS